MLGRSSLYLIPPFQESKMRLSCSYGRCFLYFFTRVQKDLHFIEKNRQDKTEKTSTIILVIYLLLQIFFFLLRKTLFFLLLLFLFSFYSIFHYFYSFSIFLTRQYLWVEDRCSQAGDYYKKFLLLRKFT